MNVLHINTRAMLGGAARAAYRLHMGLLAEGCPSRIVSIDDVPGREDLQAWVPSSGPWRGVRKATTWAEIHLGLEGLADVSSWAGHRKHAAWADLINAHSLNRHFFSMLLLARLERAAPMVWSLHDMWLLTGHCGYPIECDGWRSGCRRCGVFTGPPLERNAAPLLYRARETVYRRIDPVLVAPSRWLLGQARRAPLTRRFRSMRIPYGLDLTTFRPIGKREARNVFGLDAQDKVLMFGSAGLDDVRKGGDLLVEALRHLRAAGATGLRLMIFGAGGEEIRRLSPYPVLDAGETGNDFLLAAAYSAADIFVLPTRADNLPLTLQESIACGTPCVSFRVGGVPDIVRPGRTGWLARPEDARDLARCLHEALSAPGRLETMSAVCRHVAEEEYDIRLMVRRYGRLYEELVEGRRSAGGRPEARARSSRALPSRPTRRPNRMPLPPAPPGKRGWPWTAEAAGPSVPAPAGGWPRISVVTPSYNQGQFIEETIRSVLLQGYPNLEYVVIDGGSTDGSVEAIRKYEPWLASWVSEPDAGQTAAINKGLGRTMGQVLAYLNSDDLYAPGALRRVGAAFADPAVQWLSGECLFFGPSAGGRRDWPRAPWSSRWRWFVRNCLFQPSTFWRREVTERLGVFAEDLPLLMDYEYWLRMVAAGYEVNWLNEVLSYYRLHPTSKTVSTGEPYVAEDRLVRERHAHVLTDWERRAVARAMVEQEARRLRWRAWQEARGGDGRAALRLLWQALRTAPALGFSPPTPGVALVAAAALLRPGPAVPAEEERVP